ncbi:hypothetical protein DBR43_16780 [Pedobacter sp. KBW06]|uniref:hypothetical protein n=1 Tax=Pedobacter sp. KBW06 TaxID=2153359 RepID=UPI000F5928FA|nr:hypothetical protein [Pedobacter sp. KBW06]RQO69718.1 hypothetical protein DBR43_16780 [Pedobacter sp. KBW06]
MRLTIKNIEAIDVTPASKPHRFDINVNGVEVDGVLTQIDIITAIKYYGMTELLDTIGEEYLRSHLECL